MHQIIVKGIGRSLCQIGIHKKKYYVKKFKRTIYGGLYPVYIKDIKDVEVWHYHCERCLVEFANAGHEHGRKVQADEDLKEIGKFFCGACSDGNHKNCSGWCVCDCQYNKTGFGIRYEQI